MKSFTLIDYRNQANLTKRMAILLERDIEMFNNGLLDAVKMDITAKFETKDMGAIEVTIEQKASWVRVCNVVL